MAYFNLKDKQLNLKNTEQQLKQIKSQNQKSHSLKKLCETCTHSNCCTEFVESFVFPSDIKNLSYLDMPKEQYLKDVTINGKKFKILRNKKNSSECIFWDSKKGCTVYNNKPFDCVMFPFDLFPIDGIWHWIVYSCNPESNWSWAESHLEKLENDPRFLEVMEDVDCYADISRISDHKSDPQYKFTILRKVKFPSRL